MSLAVHFDNALSFRATEIDDEVPDGVLAAKAESGELVVAEAFPEFALGGRHGSAQGFGAVEDFRRGAFVRYVC
ncbi:MAG TPA: hypothetical protein VJ020_12780 [Anaerolineales bacterium]|nr:hypothetical protein [Anaerolineales bacterium]